VPITTVERDLIIKADRFGTLVKSSLYIVFVFATAAGYGDCTTIVGCMIVRSALDGDAFGVLMVNDIDSVVLVFILLVFAAGYGCKGRGGGFMMGGSLGVELEFLETM
jgi:hypothetical protein